MDGWPIWQTKKMMEGQTHGQMDEQTARHCNINCLLFSAEDHYTFLFLLHELLKTIMPFCLFCMYCSRPLCLFISFAWTVEDHYTFLFLMHDSILEQLARTLMGLMHCGSGIKTLFVNLLYAVIIALLIRPLCRLSFTHIYEGFVTAPVWVSESNIEEVVCSRNLASYATTHSAADWTSSVGGPSKWAFPWVYV